MLSLYKYNIILYKYKYYVIHFPIDGTSNLRIQIKSVHKRIGKTLEPLTFFLLNVNELRDEQSLENLPACYFQIKISIQMRLFSNNKSF